MENATLRARTREATGSRAARRIRREGIIPAVLYGEKNEPQPIQIDEREFRALLSQGLTENTLIALQIDDEKKTDRLTLIREVQRDPIRGSFRHIDFVHIDLAHEVTVDVPVHLIGDSVGVKMGGISEQRLHAVEIRCLPTDIPEFFEVDISDLEIGDSLHVSDMRLGNYDVHTDEARTVVSIAAPRVKEEEEEVVVLEEEVIEPALVGEEEPSEEPGEADEDQ
jgi:large subunit ribosomal protein L25